MSDRPGLTFPCASCAGEGLETWKPCRHPGACPCDPVESPCSNPLCIDGSMACYGCERVPAVHEAADGSLRCDDCLEDN